MTYVSKHFRTVQQLSDFVAQLTPGQRRQLDRRQRQELDAMPFSDDELVAIRRKLMSSGGYRTAEEAAAFLTRHATEEETKAAADAHRLRQAESLIRAADWLHKNLDGKRRRT